MNIADNLKRARIFFPEKAAILFAGRTVTYGQLDDAAGRMAGRLAALGVCRGDRVALFLPNIPPFIAWYYAIQKAGAVAVSISAMARAEEVGRILLDTGARVLVTTAELAVEVGTDGPPPLSHRVIVGGEAGDDLSMGGPVSAAGGGFAALPMAGDDSAAILYTSGTTGAAKGVVLTQANLVSNAFATVHHTGMLADDRLHLFLPLFHCFGQNFIMNAAINACATLVLHRRFKPGEVLDSVRENRVTMFFGVPTVYIHLLGAGVEASDVAGVRFWFSAAASMPTSVSARWEERVGLVLNEGYGLTECSPFAAYNHDLRYRAGTVGWPIENVEMRVVDDGGETLPPGRRGEIIIRGPNVMRGYWNNPAATDDAIRGGWLHSGDIGVTDEEGYFYVVDRLKEMINVSGFKVYPSEVEQLLHRHRAVKEAAVYGVFDPVKGERVRAAVVLVEGESACEKELVEFCRENIAAIKAPGEIDLLETLPKSATGKILKTQLRQEHSERP